MHFFYYVYVVTTYLFFSCFNLFIHNCLTHAYLPAECSKWWASKICWFKKWNGQNASFFSPHDSFVIKLCQYVVVVWLFISVDLKFTQLHVFWRWCCICLPFNLKMCKKTSSWYTKTSFNNKVNVRQLYQLWVCHLLLAICFNYVIIWRREALYSPVTPNKVKPKQDNQVLDESETMI